MIILIILIIVLLLSFNLFRNLFKYDTTILDDVKLKEEEPNNNGFALMLETENTDGTTSYVESTSSTWPTDMKFNSEKSGCVDVNNNIIEDALSFNTSTNSVMVSTNQTAYCYVFFDIDKSLANYIKNNPPAGFNTTLEGGLYRYQGTNDVVTNNYICFGTSDKDTCVNNIDKYMYRIIGIDENKQIKLIKETSIGSYKWHSDDTTNTSWSESDLYKGLNGINGGYYSDIFVNNSIYDYMEKNSNWYNKIVNYNWKYGNNNDNSTDINKTASALYNVENGWTNIVSAKIGLIYAHDYYYAYRSGGLNCSSSGSYSTCKKAWIYLESNEWTMSRGFHSGSLCYGVFVYSYFGDVNFYVVNTAYAVRPVFFLENTVEYFDGIGTSDDPFLIKE